ncbi:MAG: FKBP-type peptidyl-prolyl cis-trans isomerase [Treponema sp.]|nr:FKBP-type peptidyl-prolyl cis-trans isomerase [Treponema sp.]
MKRWVIPFCLFLAAMTVQAKGIREEIEFTGDKARVSYAFGMTVGGDLQQAGMEIDYVAFVEGLKSAMEQEQTLMDKNEAREVVQEAFQASVRKRSEALRLQEELFLAENAARSGVRATESGLQYEVLEASEGVKPALTDVVLVHYEGRLVDGTVFDSSYDRGNPEQIPLNMVIPGWSEGLQLMNVGSKYRLFIPSRMAYGERGAGQFIPPYSTLIFTIELLGIVEDEDDDEEDDD